MPGSKRSENAMINAHAEFVKSEVARQVCQNETALLQILENLASCHPRQLIEMKYFEIHEDSTLADQDFAALARLTEVLNVLSGRAAIKPKETM